jgi:hypothetical protein
VVLLLPDGKSRSVYAIFRKADAVAIREKAEQLIAELQKNKDAGTKLLLESVNTDIGVGD